MRHLPFHLKYRPQTLADLVGQQPIATTLTNAITTGRIAPAYLFSGPRGTGKTSTARILAKSLNCLSEDNPTVTPCGQCDSCGAIASSNSLDVIEIDAASNNSVEQIRDLIEKSQFVPHNLYKVWILDECHALSHFAIQALLKTLENPPERVVFILCTTEPERLGDTIISRCQRFNFRRESDSVIIEHLAAIAQRENITIDPHVLRLIAQHCQGGLRDAQCLLEQLSLLSNTLTPEQVYELTGSVPEQDLLLLFNAIQEEDTEQVIKRTRELYEVGLDPLVIAQNLLEFHITALLAQTADNAELGKVTASTWEILQGLNIPDHRLIAQISKLKSGLTQIKLSRVPRIILEVTLIGLFAPNDVYVPSPPNSSKELSGSAERVPHPSVNKFLTPLPASIATLPCEPINLDSLWKQIIAAQTQKALSALLNQQAKLVALQENVATIQVPEVFKPRISQSSSTLSDSFEKILGHKVNIELVV
ncbi:DNA polymerase III subunit gamma/tau [Gloeothece verrucosa]|uniref:DNA polymerase III subunit gamma/tau n=1 Tax=Gloeothece verrucosa (strain PCC 7822) TaxID=497965 RepID=E0UMC9_GLOV7|nr:DNA polymerase III subunit gamma/tau [Gloeothece verrucosa]ADN18109.1 DNA polymerase III, subunits gamma and tau [Gloeothece verrucosa PCC 7822]